ncbi:HTH_48 domain-containing protein [Trichonephila clavipes]|uniref:HTH_48 domain-containing protein n=1 Tax=Trichonephila clavipes TaxID=2585209 RepID=A0A8X6UVD1_TRICX|nr:HTH_48 domain-containing protein [Trichonephila clavipes]
MKATRVEQRAYIKVAVLRGRNAMEWHSELVEALGKNALPYRTVARWVGKFQQGRVSTSDEQRGAVNADADGIQRLPHRCGDSSRGLGPGRSCQLYGYRVVILLHREGHIALYTTVIN